MGAKISRIDVYPIHINFRSGQEFVVAYGAPKAVDNVFVKMTTSDGLEGFGEASAHMSFNGETQASIMAFMEYVCPRLVGEDPFNICKVNDMLDILPGNLSAKTAIDIALYDLMGKAAGLPLYKLIGGATKMEVPMHFTLSIKNADGMAEDALRYTTEGYRCLEVKLGKVGATVKLEDEVEKIRRIREAVGSGITLVVDSNIGWSPNMSVDIIRRIEQYNVYVEQPTKGIRGLQFVRKHVSAPIVADESCHTPEDVIELAQKEAADAINIKLLKVGGYHKAISMISIAEATGIGYRFDSRLQTRFASTACLHLAMTTSREISAGFAAFTRQKEDIVKEGGIVLEKGIAKLADPNAPGIGAELKEELFGKGLTFT